MTCISWCYLNFACAFVCGITVRRPPAEDHKDVWGPTVCARWIPRECVWPCTPEQTGVFFVRCIHVWLPIDMTEMFSTLFGQNEAQGPPGSSSLGFGPSKPPPPLPQSQVPLAAQMPPQLGDEGPALRKPGAMNEPFYLLRELPGTVKLSYIRLHCALCYSSRLLSIGCSTVCKQC